MNDDYTHIDTILSRPDVAALAKTAGFERQLNDARRTLAARPMPFLGRVCCDIARRIGALGLAAQNCDPRDDPETFWSWAQEFQADFEVRMDRGEEPGNTYYEDVDEFAEKRALADGWVAFVPQTVGERQGA